jgi:hypothetical protein
LGLELIGDTKYKNTTDDKKDKIEKIIRLEIKSFLSLNDCKSYKFNKNKIKIQIMYKIEN